MAGCCQYLRSGDRDQNSNTPCRRLPRSPHLNDCIAFYTLEKPPYTALFACERCRWLAENHHEAWLKNKDNPQVLRTCHKKPGITPQQDHFGSGTASHRHLYHHHHRGKQKNSLWK